VVVGLGWDGWDEVEQSTIYKEMSAASTRTPPLRTNTLPPSHSREQHNPQPHLKSTFAAAARLGRPPSSMMLDVSMPSRSRCSWSFLATRWRDRDGWVRLAGGCRRAGRALTITNHGTRPRKYFPHPPLRVHTHREFTLPAAAAEPLLTQQL